MIELILLWILYYYMDGEIERMVQLYMYDTVNIDWLEILRWTKDGPSPRRTVRTLIYFFEGSFSSFSFEHQPIIGLLAQPSRHDPFHLK